MRLELTRVGLLVELANHYTTRGALSATRVLNSFEELCIKLAAAGNFFARELNPKGEHILLSIDRLFRSIRTLECG